MILNILKKAITLFLQPVATTLKEKNSDPVNTACKTSYRLFSRFDA